MTASPKTAVWNAMIRVATNAKNHIIIEGNCKNECCGIEESMDTIFKSGE